MDTLLLMNANIDCEKGIARCMGNEALYARLIGRMIDDTNMERACACLEQQDYEGVYARLHELKGVSGNLGMLRVFDLCGVMLRQLKDERYEELPAYMEQLAEAHGAAVSVIQKALR